ncbi:MAG: zinc metallopeptidase [Thermoflavifilum sp.]|uniref:zinc metallopeptidase n=1 Tax=Thermoflavifilum sp. TaxID=1968839 RepID=UPI0018A615B6|nr:zinc metallopeptidase [Thermoflavifilum sp.]QOR76906.1 MAG: zinc metallopeptidase [Thermoflavifilum sp.]
MAGWFLLMILVAGAGLLISLQLRSKFNTYSKVPLQAGLTGKEVAEKMLHDNGIYDVQVISVEGMLTDHYNPMNKTVNLSPDVYHGSSVAAAAVAAHECGHAVQHARAYSMLMLRSQLVPVVQFSAGIVNWILLAGILTFRFFPQLLLIGIILFAVITLFALITLPVEFDASRRGLAWLTSAHITTPAEYEKARDALWWAAMTYVVAAINSLITLFYYISIFLGGRNRN